MPGLFDGAFDPSRYGLLAPIAAGAKYGIFGHLNSGVIGQDLAGVAGHLASLPQRALNSADTFQRTGQYDPAPILEAAGMMVGSPFTPRGALGSSAGKLGRSEEAQALRDTAAIYGRSDPELRASWQKHGREVDWVESVPDASWARAAREWNASVPGQQIDPNKYIMGSNPAFEGYMQSLYPASKEAYPGRSKALEWFAENDPLAP